MREAVSRSAGHAEIPVEHYRDLGMTSVAVFCEDTGCRHDGVIPKGFDVRDTPSSQVIRCSFWRNV
jgi:hypothetical protein